MHEKNEGGSNRMRKSQRDRRTYLIIGLCAVVAIMAVGFAAFSQQLQINGTSEVTSTWCVGFDTTKTSDYVATAGLAGATTPTATMSYSGNTCGSDSLQTGASMSASFKQPGDQVVYTFTIKNASSLNAKLDSISENLTTSNSAIEYTLSGASANDILGPNDTTTLVVTVRYKNSVTSQPETTTWGLELKLNFSQTNDSPSGGGSGGGSSESSTPDGYYVFDTDGHSIGDEFNTSGLTLNAFPSGKNVAIKYVVSGGNITEDYACTKFSFINEPVCLQGGGNDETTDSSPYYTANRGIIEGLATTFEAQNPAGSCSAGDYGGDCSAGDLDVYANSYGSVRAYDDQADEGCYVDNVGNASCG